ncbi:leucyl aminopeptidase family protein [Arthrobacter sp. APC 3897]|uniref:leucyl aminopeptidase family protein n=1 Tax=Arthrobacter sp. APC 3897 TaxID=3035204 RepID=UPI0025B2AE0B|nr:leucyl aminopeptidase family protein [Arthrobacter sp. APC 3897]MDN3482244.1 leucyl aminopeptidase family protein [Arthrobacter sp. APC 3897]
MQRLPKGSSPATSAAGEAPGTEVPGIAMTAVTAADQLQAGTGAPTTGTGLRPAPGEEVDVLAVAIAAAPETSPREDSEESLHPTPQPRRGAVETALWYGVDVAARAATAGVTGKAGETLLVEPPSDRAADLPAKLIFVGVGDESVQSLRRAGAALARAARGANRVRAAVVDGLGAAAQQAFLEGFLLGGYQAPRQGKTPAGPSMARAMEVTGLDAEALRLALVTARAVWLARDLTNLPPDTATPDWMAAQSRAVAERAGLEITVLEEAELLQQGFGGLTAVGSGSANPPRLVQVTYQPSAETAEHVVLVGKGITFDSGGISLKPRDAMMSMKMDMAGAAVVLAAVEAAAELELPHRVTGILALAENAIGASAYRPGDVVTTYGGTTVEIGNTDAEGRMVLADALAYAAAGLAPDVLVDIATLTGAAALGLGQQYGAVFSNAPVLLEALEQAGEASGDRVWPLPLVHEYDYALNSQTADVAHVAPPALKFGAGAIVAALFLEKFVDGVPWAHLDIAGPMSARADKHEIAKGATGFGTRLLISFLRDLPALRP